MHISDFIHRKNWHLRWLQSYGKISTPEEFAQNHFECFISIGRICWKSHPLLLLFKTFMSSEFGAVKDKLSSIPRDLLILILLSKDICSAMLTFHPINIIQLCLDNEKMKTNKLWQITNRASETKRKRSFDQSTQIAIHSYPVIYTQPVEWRF